LPSALVAPNVVTMGPELKPISAAASEGEGPAEPGRTPPASARWPLPLVEAISRVRGWRLSHLEARGGDGLVARLHAEGAPESWWEITTSLDQGISSSRFSDGVAPDDSLTRAVESELVASCSDAFPEPHPGLMESAEDLLDVLAPAFGSEGDLGGGWRLREVLEARRGDDPRGGFVLECFHPDRADAYHLVLRSPAVAGEIRVGGVGIHDYVAGPEQWPDVAIVRARVIFALSLADAPRILAPVVAVSSLTETLPPVDPTMRERFDRDGYVVVPGAAGPIQVETALEAVAWFLGLDPSLEDRWYYDIIPYAHQTNLQRGGTFLELYHHQALWDLRSSEAVYALFRALWGRDDLWVSLDRVGFKPPLAGDRHPAWRDQGCVHWDVDLDELPLPFGVQGLVALTDAGPEHGTFHCAPGMHNQLETLVADQGEIAGRHPGADAFEMVPVALKAGDLLVWHHGLPHRTGPNTTPDPRLVAYLSMAPARDNEQERLERIRSWRDRLPGASHFEGDPLRREERHGATAELTPLGRRLLGQDPW
jgi:ectoine hydroxylase-related dioxygenase (phytanoyl-CoA dioxygenase family)